MRQRVVGLLIVWLTLLGGNYFLYMTVLPVRVLHHAVITGVLGYWLVKRGIPRTPFVLPIFGVIFAAFVSALLSRDPRMALENVWFWFNHGLLFLLFIDLNRQGYGEDLMHAHLWIVGLIGVWGFEQWALPPGSVRPASLFGIVNLAGAYCAPLVVVAAAYFHSTRDKAYLVPGALALLMVLLNQSRGGLLALTVGLLAFGFLQSILRVRVRLILLPVAALTVALVLAQIGSSLHRVDMYRTAGIMIADHGFFGVGPGLYGIVHRDLAILPGDYIAGAHNLTVNIAAEIGTVGLLMCLWLFVLFVASIDRQRSARENGALAALMAMMVHGLVDNQVATAYAALVMVLAAYLVAHNYRARIRPFGLKVDPTVRQRIVLTVVACALIGSYAGFLLDLDTAQMYYDASLITGDVESARFAYEQDPLELYRLNLAALEVQAAFTQDVTGLVDASLGIDHRSEFAMANYARYWR